jgi:hypothetical protein
MRKTFTFTLLLLLLGGTWQVAAQKVGMTTNLAYWGTSTPNIGVEFALGKKLTLDLSAGYNLWVLDKKIQEVDDQEKVLAERKILHFLVQPELRYWTCEAFNGFYMGTHGHFALYNVANMNIPFGRLKELKDARYEATLYGGGLSFGYQWYLSPRWNMGASIGGGYAFIDYDKFPSAKNTKMIGEGTYHYFGITKLSLSFTYFFPERL